MRLFILWLSTAVAVLALSYILPWVEIDSFQTALVVAIVLGVVNLFVKPLLLLVTLPVNILTLGLFTFVINALIILLVDNLVDGFAVGGFFSALIVSLGIGVINGVIMGTVKS